MRVVWSLVWPGLKKIGFFEAKKKDTESSMHSQLAIVYLLLQVVVFFFFSESERECQ